MLKKYQVLELKGGRWRVYIFDVKQVKATGFIRKRFFTAAEAQEKADELNGVSDE